MERAAAGPHVGEQLVAEMEEAVLGALRGGGPMQYRQMVANIAAANGLPRTREESHRQPDASIGIRFVEVNVAVAEAVWRLIGLGMVVPVGGTDSPETSWSVITANTSGSDRREELGLEVPHQLRLSSSAVGWLAAGTIAIRNPDLYLRDLPPMRDRVGACLREAVEAYRRGLPLACVILLGAASEAAWREVGSAIADATDDEELRGSLDAGAAAVQEATYEAVLRHFDGSRPRADTAIRRETESYPDWLRFLARFYSELRNYAAHEDVPPLPIDLDVAATLLRQAHDYFAALYRLPATVTE